MTDLRTYIAGIGSSGALIAAVVVAFFALGGIVAIKGLPESSDSASGGSVLVETDARDEVTVAEATAPTTGQRDDVAARPDRDASGTGDGDGRGNGGNAPAPGGETPQPVDPAFPPTDPPGLTPPAPDPPDPNPEPQPPPPNPEPPPQPQPPPPPQPTPPKGPVGGLVEGTDGAIGDIVGFHPGLAESIVPITEPIDGVIGVITNPIKLPGAP